MDKWKSSKPVNFKSEKKKKSYESNRNVGEMSHWEDVNLKARDVKPLSTNFGSV